MPVVRKGRRLISAHVSDIHLSLLRPVSRGEDDWLGTTKKALGRVVEIVNAAKAHPHDSMPLVMSGDLFDRWNAAPELINFALKYLPPMIAIPGQHDLPYHSLTNIERSAFLTMACADKITYVGPAGRVGVDGGMITCFPWGVETKKPEPALDGLQIAIVHAYCWKTGCDFPGAPPEGHVDRWAKRLAKLGYDVAFFGDNHKPFKAEYDKITIVNCGPIMRRSANDADIEPSVWLLYSDGSVKRKKLNLEEQLLTRKQMVAKVESQAGDFDAFIEDARQISAGSFEFMDILMEIMERRRVRRELREQVMKLAEKK